MALDSYQILGVLRGASDDEIRIAYLRLAGMSHPDLNSGDARAESKFKAIRLAYETLVDPATRRKYDCGETRDTVIYSRDHRQDRSADINWAKRDSYDIEFKIASVKDGFWPSRKTLCAAGASIVILLISTAWSVTWLSDVSAEKQALHDQQLKHAVADIREKSIHVASLSTQSEIARSESTKDASASTLEPPDFVRDRDQASEKQLGDRASVAKVSNNASAFMIGDFALAESEMSAELISLVDSTLDQVSYQDPILDQGIFASQHDANPLAASAHLDGLAAINGVSSAARAPSVIIDETIEAIVNDFLDRQDIPIAGAVGNVLWTSDLTIQNSESLNFSVVGSHRTVEQRESNSRVAVHTDHASLRSNWQPQYYGASDVDGVSHDHGAIHGVTPLNAYLDRLQSVGPLDTRSHVVSPGMTRSNDGYTPRTSTIDTQESQGVPYSLPLGPTFMPSAITRHQMPGRMAPDTPQTGILSNRAFSPSVQNPLPSSSFGTSAIPTREELIGLPTAF